MTSSGVPVGDTTLPTEREFEEMRVRAQRTIDYGKRHGMTVNELELARDSFILQRAVIVLRERAALAPFVGEATQ